MRIPLEIGGNLAPSSAANGTSVTKESPDRFSTPTSDADISPDEEHSQAPWRVSNSAADAQDSYTGTSKCKVLKAFSSAGISDLMRADL